MCCCCWFEGIWEPKGVKFGMLFCSGTSSWGVFSIGSSLSWIWSRMSTSKGLPPACSSMSSKTMSPSGFVKKLPVPPFSTTETWKKKSEKTRENVEIELTQNYLADLAIWHHFSSKQGFFCSLLRSHHCLLEKVGQLLAKCQLYQLLPNYSN